MSRREADEAIEKENVTINGATATLGQRVEEGDEVKLSGNVLEPKEFEYLLLNKPINYVSSRKQQGDTPTIYSLIPEEFHHLKPAGRLDADSHGLMLLTNDGSFANEMTHPSSEKQKNYEVQLDKPLEDEDVNRLADGVQLEDGTSKLLVENGDPIKVMMHEGRNRQIRRTFEALGYTVTDLKRTALGPYDLEILGEKVYSTTDKRKSSEE